MPTPTASIQFPKTNATVHLLSNGLEVILQEDHQAPVVSVQAWVKTGSMHEAEMLGAGVSHLVEHMVFKGAGGKGPSQLAQMVQGSGGYLNAYTSFDRTVYYVDTLAEGFPVALDVVASLVAEAEFPEDEYEKEKDVIRREMDMGKDDPGRTLSQLMFRTVFREHPYREPVIGHLELFNAITREKALRYYTERYSPRNMFVVVSGAIPKAEALAAVEARLGSKENRLGQMPLIGVEPLQTSKRESHEEFATEVTNMEMAWRIPDLLHPDTPALEVLGVLMGTGRSSRLYQKIREEQQLAHEINAGAYTPNSGGVFYVGCEVESEKRVATETAILEEIRRVQHDGVSDAEVRKAGRIFLSRQLGALVSASGQASDLASNWLSASNLDFSKDYLQGIDRVTPADIQRVAQNYLVDNALSICSLNPKGSLPQKHFYVGSGMKREVEKTELANGVTLLVKEDDRLPFVYLHGTLRGGSLTETAETNGRGLLFGRTMIKGAGSRDAEAVVEDMESVGASVNASSGGSSFSVSAGFLTPDLSLGMEVWSDVLLRPHFPEPVVEAEKERILAKIKSDEDSIGFVAMRQLRKELYGEHPFSRTVAGSAESVPGLNRQMLLDFHKDTIVGGNLVVACYGNVSSSEIRDRVEAALTSLPKGARKVTGEHSPLPDASGRIITLERDKKQAFLAVGFPIVDLTHPDRLALDLIDEACSDMASRLFIRIREEHGLAYSVGTTQMLGMTRGAFIFHLSTAPEKLEFAQSELLSEIALIAKEGLNKEEVERAKKTWLGKTAMQAQSNASQAEGQSLEELYGLGWDHQARTLKKLETLSLAQINDVAARYFGAAEGTIVRVKGIAGE